MCNGQVEQVGTPKEIYDRPASPFVAQFIGKANFLTGRVLETDADVTWVESNEVKLKATTCSYTPTAGETVTLMIRPEQIRFGGGIAEGTAENQMPGKLASITYIGQLLELQIETAIGRLTVIQLGHADLNAPDRQETETKTVSWSAQHCIVIPVKVAP
jgi:ABC-type Fe3+/spermidine/putrescine transport system ATPase subunit